MKRYTLLVFFLLSLAASQAQMVTGIWRGTITKGKGLMAKSMKMEVKLIKKADSLLGTCYYYVNPKMYMRYSVVGYFDVASNSVHWQDFRFISSKPEHKATDPDVVTTPMKSTADFNCPNPNAVAKLDGYSEIGEGELYDTHLTKVSKSFFPDEWDNVIEGYTIGMAHPDVIDSVWAISSVPREDPLLAVKEKEAKAKAEAEEKTRIAAAAKAKAEAEEKARLEATAKAKAEAEEKAKQESIAKAKTEAEEKAKEEAIAKAKMEAEEKAKQEQIAKAKAEADEKAKQESIAKAKTEAEEKAKQEQIAKAKAEADEKAQVEETAKAKAEAEARAEQEKIARAKKETEEKAQQQEMAKAKAAADEKAKQDAIVAKAKAMEEKSKQEAIAKATAEQKARDDSRAKARAAEEKTKQAATTAAASTVAVASGNKPTAAPAISSLPERHDPEAIQKFTARRKIQQGELPMQGDTIELHFYDNAEVDGDSISLFVNGRLMFNHVKLSTQPFIFKLGVKDLPDNSELAMLAENLGAIPPNTALMLAFVKGERLSFRLESTEQSTGTIKMVRR